MKGKTKHQPTSAVNGGALAVRFSNGVTVQLKGGSGQYCGVKFRLHGSVVKVSAHGQTGVIVMGAQLSAYGEADLTIGGHLTVNRQNGRLIRA